MTRINAIDKFLPGLFTDAIADAPGLLRLQDAYLSREGEIRKRGGKSEINDDIAGDGSITNVYLHAYNHNAGELVVTEANGDIAIFGNNGSFWTNLGNGWYDEPSGFGDVSVDFNGLPSSCNYDDEIFFCSDQIMMKWRGGSLENRILSTPTSVVNGLVTSASATWLTDGVSNKDYISIPISGYENVFYRIVRVISETQIQIDSDITFVFGVGNCIVSSIAPVIFPDTIFFDVQTYRTFPVNVVASHADKLFVATEEKKFRGSNVEPTKERIRWCADLGLGGSNKFGNNYWHPNAYVDVGTGIGGDITALISTGAELLIFKEHAIFVLRGEVDSFANDLGARVDVVSQHFGAMGPQSVEYTPIGVVFANEFGLFVYSDGQIQSLTNQRVSRFWNEEINGSSFTSSNFSNSIIVSSIGNRIIAQSNIGPANQRTSLIYDLELDYFYSQTSEKYSKIIRDIDGTGDLAVTRNGAIHDWSSDFTTENPSDPSGLYPEMIVTTQPVRLGETPFSGGRLNNIFVNGYISDPEFVIDITLGRKGIGSGAEPDLSIPYNFTSGAVDETQRLPVDGIKSDTSARITVRQTGEASDARLYALGIGYEPSKVYNSQ